MSVMMSRVCRVCRRVLSVRPVSAGANEWWKGRLRPKCNIMLSSLFPNESTSRASIALNRPLLHSEWGHSAAGCGPARRQIVARPGPVDYYQQPGAIYYQLYRLKKAHQPPRGQLMGLSKCNAHWRARTADQSIKSALLYQLS